MVPRFLLTNANGKRELPSQSHSKRLTPMPTLNPSPQKIFLLTLLKDKKQVRDRLAKLRQVINHHRYLYHVLDREEISAAALDSLKRELSELEKQFPELVTPDSPTQRIAGAPLRGFRKVTHQVAQWSFNDVFTPDELREFDERVARTVLKKDAPRTVLATPPTYTAELKIDGFKIV